MKNIPLCCEKNKLKKIIWEELHASPELGTLIDRRESLKMEKTMLQRTKGAQKIHTFVSLKSKRMSNSNSKDKINRRKSRIHPSNKDLAKQNSKIMKLNETSEKKTRKSP